MNHLSSLKSAKGGRQLLWLWGHWTTGGPYSLLGDGSMATQKPGTKLTIISGVLRGRRCIHEEDVFDKSVDSPVPVPAFRVRLVTEDGEPVRSVVVGCIASRWAGDKAAAERHYW